MDDTVKPNGEAYSDDAGDESTREMHDGAASSAPMSTELDAEPVDVEPADDGMDPAEEPEAPAALEPEPYEFPEPAVAEEPAPGEMAVPQELEGFPPGEIVASEESPEPEPEPAAAAEPAPDLSLEAMMTELGASIPPLDETPAETEPSDAAEAGEAETAEAEEPSAEGETEAEAAEAEDLTSWRDAAAAEAAAGEIEPLVRKRLSTRLPFWIYGGVWAIFVGVMTYLMWPLSTGPFVNAPYYAYFVLGCAVLLAAGPILAVVVWAWTRSGASPEERQGLIRAISLRTVGWMTIGVVLMWVGLYLLDLHRIHVIG